MVGRRGTAGSGRALCTWAELREKGGEGGQAEDPRDRRLPRGYNEGEGSMGGPGPGRREGGTQCLTGPPPPTRALCWGRAAAWVVTTLTCGVTRLEACGGCQAP